MGLQNGERKLLLRLADMVSLSIISGPEREPLTSPDGSYTDGCKEPPMSRQFICTRVEFNCETCGKHVEKWWHPDYYGKPRFCSRDCKSEFQRRAKPVTKEWLEQKYLVEMLDCVQIGKLVSRDPKSVWNWLKDFGIPTRKRGQTGNGKGNAWHPSKGTPNPFLGEHHTEETKQKLRDRQISDESRQRQRDARLRDGHVPYLKNGKHWLHSVGKDRHPRWKGGITPERQALYATEEWKKAARTAKRRDRRTCQRCGKVKRKGDGLSFDLHHIVPFECVSLRCEASNLVYLCEPCHYWVHSQDNIEGRFVLPCP